MTSTSRDKLAFEMLLSFLLYLASSFLTLQITLKGKVIFFFWFTLSFKTYLGKAPPKCRVLCVPMFQSFYGKSQTHRPLQAWHSQHVWHTGRQVLSSPLPRQQLPCRVLSSGLCGRRPDLPLPTPEREPCKQGPDR